MSMVHRQRAVLLQFPLVIYLAALLKCSRCWHWLTNQTVKPHPEYQTKHGFKIFVYHLLLDYVLHKSSWWDDSCFSVAYMSRVLSSALSKVLNLKERHGCGWQESIQPFSFVGTANQHPLKSSSDPRTEKCLSSKLVAEVASICVASARIILSMLVSLKLVLVGAFEVFLHNCPDHLWVCMWCIWSVHGAGTWHFNAYAVQRPKLSSSSRVAAFMHMFQKSRTPCLVWTEPKLLLNRRNCWRVCCMFHILYSSICLEIEIYCITIFKLIPKADWDETHIFSLTVLKLCI